MNKVVTPKLIEGVLDELDEGHQEAPWVGAVDDQSLQHHLEVVVVWLVGVVEWLVGVVVWLVGVVVWLVGVVEWLVGVVEWLVGVVVWLVGVVLWRFERFGGVVV